MLLNFVKNSTTLPIARVEPQVAATTVLPACAYGHYATIIGGALLQTLVDVTGVLCDARVGWGSAPLWWLSAERKGPCVSEPVSRYAQSRAAT